MRGLSPAQREIAETLFNLPAAAGFALAGGSALVALQLVDRPREISMPSSVRNRDLRLATSSHWPTHS